MDCMDSMDRVDNVDDMDNQTSGRGYNMTLDELQACATEINRQIHALLQESGFDQYGEIDIQHDYNPDTLYTVNMLTRYLYNLDCVTDFVDQLNAPIDHYGVLGINKNGRPDLNGKEFTCGDTIEFVKHCEKPYWEVSRIEAHRGKYYLTADPEQELDGLTVRTKKN